MVIYWMRRWGRSSDTDGTAPGVAGTAKRRTHFRMLGDKKNPWSQGRINNNSKIDPQMRSKNMRMIIKPIPIDKPIEETEETLRKL